MTDHVAKTKNKGMLTRTCRTILSFLGMAVAKGGEGREENRVPVNAICRQIFGSYSEGAAKRIMAKASIKRKRFDEEDLSQFNIIDKEKKRWKFSEDEIEKLQGYMVDNTFTRQSPMKYDTLRKKRIPMLRYKTDL